MNQFINNLYFKILLLLLSTLIIVIFWINSKLNYWKRQKIPYLKPRFLWGNLTNPFTSKETLGIIFKDFYDEMKKKGKKYAGFYAFTNPIFVPIDPEWIKTILIKDFSNFHGRGFYSNEKDQPISVNLLSVDGPKWRRLRNKFSPAFTTGKIKYMFPLVEKCTEPLLEKISLLCKNKEPVNVLNEISKYTADSIGSCAFGVDCNSFKKDETLLKIIKICTGENVGGFLRLTLLSSFPNLARFFKRKLYPEGPVKILSDMLTETYEKRKNNLVYRSDFLQLMKDIGEKTNDDDLKLSLVEIQAQSVLFFLAGYETSSKTLTFLLLEFAEHLDIQEKARKEIFDVIEKYGEINFETLQKMNYLQSVIDESLRLNPTIPSINRVCSENYKLDNGEILEKGVNIFIPVLAIHRDPEFYPNPDTFDPDRFSEENKPNLRPYTYLPFADGPRNCIGARFGLIQVKIAAVHLLRNFKFTVNKNMDRNRKYSSSFTLTLEQDVLLDVEKI